MDDAEFKIKVVENLSKINEKLEHVPTKEDLGKVKGLAIINKTKLTTHKWLFGLLFTGSISVLITSFTK